MISVTSPSPRRSRSRLWRRVCLTVSLLVSLAALIPGLAHAGTETTGTPPVVQKK